MTSEGVAVVGTGLIGTSIAMAAIRAGDRVRGYDPEPPTLEAAVKRASGLEAAADAASCVADASLVFVCVPVAAVPAAVLEALRASTRAVVTDVASVKSHVVVEVERRAAPADRARFVGGHPMGGSERSGPESASPALLDGAVWVLTPTEAADAGAIERVSAWISRVGARPIAMDAERHDRLVAFVSHLPQVASTALMDVAAGEEAGEPDILLLAAGGFRDLTRLAASNPHLWSEILLANREQVAAAIDRYAARLAGLRDAVRSGRGEEVERTFATAKDARLALAAKPQVKTGVAVLQIPVPDRPGVLADVAAAVGEAGVNIEDLQIVHSPEGGRGMVHLTVAATAAERAAEALAGRRFEALRLA
jgi:prephenate dehydrogenase